jgi:hypothetical protein
MEADQDPTATGGAKRKREEASGPGADADGPARDQRARGAAVISSPPRPPAPLLIQAPGTGAASGGLVSAADMAKVAAAVNRVVGGLPPTLARWNAPPPCPALRFAL